MASQTVVPITAPPKAGQLVEHEGKTYTTVKEGLAYILIPPGSTTQQDPLAKTKANGDTTQQPQSVFYNPIQQFNRDLTVFAINAFADDLCARRRSKYEANRGKFAEKRDKRKERKRLREEDGVGSSKIKAQKTGEDVKTEANPHVDEPQTSVTGTSEHVASEASAVAGQSAGETKTEALQSPKDAEKPLDSEHPPEQQQPWRPQFRILDALSATGLRALRYAQEIPSATQITANDMDRGAVKSIDLNIHHNDLTSKIRSSHSNALAHMYGVAHPPGDSHGPDHVSAKYDVIDLDPYGTAAPFIDAALQALNDGGMLCVTCTDSGVFASCGYPEKTFSLYGGLPVKGAHSHEGGLRVILQTVATTAARHGIAIEPLLCLSIDYYVRLFVRVRRSPADVKFLAGKSMLVYGCDAGCGAWTTQLLGRNTKADGKGDTKFWKHTVAQAPNADRSCEHCGSKTHIAGPMWAGPLHHPDFIKNILTTVGKADKSIYNTIPRIEGMLDTASDELFAVEYAEKPSLDQPIIPKLATDLLDRQPFFFMPSALAKVVHCQAPPEAAIKGALRHAGYRATRSHCKPGSIKTNAPWSALWEVVREWVKQKSPVKEENIRKGSPGWKILRLEQKEHQTSDEQQKACTEESNGSVTEPSPEFNNSNGGKHSDSDIKNMKVVFDEALGRDKPGKKLVRYQENPRENWGPMSRAKAKDTKSSTG